MNINYGDSNIVVDYIQMFLKEYYSKFIKFESKYTKELQENLIKYLNSFDSLDRNELIIQLSEYSDLNSDKLTKLFYIKEKIDEIQFIAKMPNSEPSNSSVEWMNNNLFAYRHYYEENNENIENNKNIENLEKFLLKRGWHIIDFNYRNTEDRCEFLIKRLNKNILPREDIYDLVNMYDAKYSEMIFASSEASIANNKQRDKFPAIYHFSSIYNFETENAEQDETKYSLCMPVIPLTDNIEYNVYKNSSGKWMINLNDEYEAEFNGLKTFTTTLYVDKENKQQYYAFYIKRPKNYKLIPDSKDDAFYLYYCYLKNIDHKSYISYYVDDNLNVESTIVNSISISLESDYWHNSEYLCFVARIKIPDYLSSNNNISLDEYKLCISYYDPDNEIDSILAYRIDDNQIMDYFKSKLDNQEDTVFNLLSPDDLKANKKFKIDLISPSEYFSNPFAIHDKLLSYILEAVVHKYSREQDIIIIQKLLANFGYIKDTYGVYDNTLKEFIQKLQISNNISERFTFEKGNTDPETEHLLNLLNNKTGGVL